MVLYQETLTSVLEEERIMSDYFISQVYPSDRRAMQQVELLLSSEGIRRDKNLDYICAMYDENYNIIATGGCFGSTLRCFAVRREHQGEGLLNAIVTHLIEVQFARGNLHLFLYTKCSSAKFFRDLGFYEIARIEGQIVFMENRRTGFSSYLKKLESKRIDAVRVAAMVINANPFTLGHQYLVEKAALENDILHLFIVSEDDSLVPFSVRKRLVMDGTAHLTNIQYHDSGSYIISKATFPSYFQKDEKAVIESHAMLDLTVFTKIAHVLGIKCRYVGEEPNSLVTGIYNEIMKERLPQNGIACTIVPRKTFHGTAISASTARQAIKEGDFELLSKLVPKTTLDFFLSPLAAPVIHRIRQEANVIHY